MNTGLQDAHNLAWRLAILYHQKKKEKNPSLNCEMVWRSMEKYQNERRPIAIDNARLSIRNFRRTLDVASSLGLNHFHAQFLKKMMENPPLSFLPIDIRKET